MTIMKKKFKILVAATICSFALFGCSDKKSEQVEDAQEENIVETIGATTETVTEVKTEATTEEAVEDVVVEEANAEMVSYSNSGGTYTLVVDNYVEFVETTTNPTCNVNNEDGLELNYGDVFITIQRFPELDGGITDLEDFYTYLNGDSFLSMVVAEDEINISNAAVVENKNQTLEMKSGNAVFVGYVFYFKTDEGFYKALISGSDLEVVEHYKNFVDNMTFNE